MIRWKRLSKFIYQPESFQKNASKVDFVCFCNAGGTVNFYDQWVQYLQNTHNLFVVQLPGRRDSFTEPLAESWEQLLLDLHQDLSNTISNQTIFFGHSFGSLVAYALLAKFKSMQEKISLLSVASRYHPGFIFNLPIHSLSDDAFVFHLVKRHSGLSSLLNDKELWDYILPPLRADYKLNETYNFSDNDSIHCPILAICYHQDIITFEQMKKWEECTKSICKVLLFKGNHFAPKSDVANIIKAVSKFKIKSTSS